MAAVRGALVLLLAWACARADAAPQGGCPWFSYPTPQPLDPNALPSALAAALNASALAVQDLLQQSGTPGIAAGVVYDQSLIWSGGFGLADLSQPGSVPNIDTVFRLGSVTKLLTTTLLLQLRDLGHVALEDEVATRVPQFAVRDPFVPPSQRGPTFRQLAMHAAGLPRESPCPTICTDYGDAWSKIAQMTLILRPDTLPVYSNLGFAVLGQALAVVEGVPYPDLVNKMIVGPMNWARSGVNATLRPPTNVARPYLSSTQPCDASVCLKDFAWGDPSGGAYSTVRELGAFLSTFFSDDESGPLLGGASRREMLATRWRNSDGESGFALTWEMERLGDYWLHTKMGDVSGYSAEVIMVPELKLGIVVLANLEEHASAPAEAMARILVPAFDALFRNMQPSLLPPNAARFVGTYVGNATGRSAQVALQAGALTLSLLGGAPLQWLGDSTSRPLLFRVLPPPGDGDSCFDQQTVDFVQTLEFQTDASGAVVSFTMDIYFGEAFVARGSRR